MFEPPKLPPNCPLEQQLIFNNDKKGDSFLSKYLFYSWKLYLQYLLLQQIASTFCHNLAAIHKNYAYG